MLRPVIHRLLFTALIPTIASLTNAQGAPAATPAASVKVESSGDTLPFTLQGFFGKPGAVEVSFRDKTTGATAWVKPGKSFSGWTVESVDTAKGAVVLAASGRRVRLEKAKETQDSEVFAAPKLKSKEESFIGKKFAMLEKDPEVEKFLMHVGEVADSRVKARHPEFYDEKGNPRTPESLGYMSAMIMEMKGLIRENKTPSVVDGAPVLESMMDGFLQAGSPPKSPNEGNEADHARFMKQYEQYELKALEAADRIYLARYGKTETPPVTPQPSENEASHPKD